MPHWKRVCTVEVLCIIFMIVEILIGISLGKTTCVDCRQSCGFFATMIVYDHFILWLS
uniref:Uncharacterized protein n=1 Tax=Arundo donax TaxID=35708 RepID=A0A0A9CKG4_ARUDO